MRSLCNSPASLECRRTQWLLRRTWEVEWDWMNTEDWGGTLNPIIAITGAHCVSPSILDKRKLERRQPNHRPRSSPNLLQCRPRFQKFLFPVFSPTPNFSLLKNPPFGKGRLSTKLLQLKKEWGSFLPGDRQQTDPFPCRCWIRNEILPLSLPPSMLFF